MKESSTHSCSAPGALNAASLGRADVVKMIREGWRFGSTAVRVGNGWCGYAQDPRGEFKAVVFADPDDEPEKWAGAKAKAGDAQLSLL